MTCHVCRTKSLGNGQKKLGVNRFDRKIRRLVCQHVPYVIYTLTIYHTLYSKPQKGRHSSYYCLSRKLLLASFLVLLCIYIYIDIILLLKEEYLWLAIDGPSENTDVSAEPCLVGFVDTHATQYSGGQSH